MIKLLGAVMVMAAAISIGLSGRRALADKVAELETLRWELGRLRARIGSCGMSLEECFMGSELFRPAAKLLRSGKTPEEAALSCGIRGEGLSLFAAGLGAETVEGQLRNIDLFAESTEAALLSAREELSKKGRLWVGLGALSGAAVCLILS